MTETKHIGKNISRLRELRSMKQETLAEALGISQQSVSKMEQNESVDDMMLERVAKILGVTPATIKNFDEEKAIYNIQNNYDSATQNVNYQFNPLEKLMQQVEENKNLYERLLQSEKDKTLLMQKVIDKMDNFSAR